MGILNRKAALLAALTTVAFAGASTAQVLDPNDARVVANWVATQKINDATTSPAVKWQVVAATAGGVAMRGVLSPRDTASNIAHVGLRLEHFAPTPGVGGLATLSEMASYEVDCVGVRMRHVASVSYADHNFMGDKKEQATTDGWTPIASMALLDATAQSACRAAPPAG